jgi:hypothetical protein
MSCRTLLELYRIKQDGFRTCQLLTTSNNCEIRSRVYKPEYRRCGFVFKFDFVIQIFRSQPGREYLAMKQFNAAAKFNVTQSRYPAWITPEQRAQLPATKQALALLTGVLL